MLIVTESSKNAVAIATKALWDDKIICFATETVYALACNASSNLAVEKLYKIKKRDLKKPIAIFVKDLTIAKEFLKLSSLENKIAQSFMPGMITLILEKKSANNKQISVSPLLNQGDSSLGLRIPNHQFCLKLLNAFDGIIAVTSANISNQEAAINPTQVAKYFKDKVNLIVDGGVCEHKISSTVLRIKNNKASILREGLITKDLIDSFLGYNPKCPTK